MTNQQKAVIRDLVKRRSLNGIANEVGVSSLTLAKVIGPLKVNRSAEEMVERFANKLLAAEANGEEETSG